MTLRGTSDIGTIDVTGAQAARLFAELAVVGEPEMYDDSITWTFAAGIFLRLIFVGDGLARWVAGVGR